MLENHLVMGLSDYDPPTEYDDSIDNGYLELVITFEILTQKGESLEQLLKDNLAEKFDAILFDCFDFDVYCDPDEAKILKEYPDGKVLYQAVASITAYCTEFEWVVTKDIHGDVIYECVPEEVNFELKHELGETLHFKDPQRIIDPRCKFIKVISLKYEDGSFDLD